MAAMHRRAKFASACLLLAIGVDGQRPADKPVEPPATTEAQVLAKLQQRPPLPVTERITAVRHWLQANPTSPRAPATLGIRLRLGSLLLEDLQGKNAVAEFSAVRAAAPPADHDLRGRALYGVAQGQELLGETAAAKTTLQQVIEELAGTRYADFARVALNRIDSAAVVAVGKHLPPIGLGTDIHGRRIEPRDLAGKPLLLVFFAPDHVASCRELDRLATAWTDGGMTEASLVAYAQGSDTTALLDLARQQHWRFPILPAPEGFLQPDWLALAVTGVPSMFLVARDGTLLARDLSAPRLTQLLR
jgi:hypothetical protein